MIRAAIYARKSNEQSVSDDAKSVTRQRELARAFAEKQGWPVVAEFEDDGISGGEFLSRDGLNRLLVACRQKPRLVDVLIVMDESRLGREQIETAYLVKKITEEAGVRIFRYVDGQERSATRPIR